MADEMTPSMEAAAFAGLADNRAIPMGDRLGAALQAITRLEDLNADLTDRLDRTLHELREVAGERDRERKHCEQMTLVADRYANERDATNAALADVSDLLDEARVERDKWKAALSEARQRVADRDKWLRDLEDAMPEEVDVESLPMSLRLWVQGVAETEQELTAERDAARAARDKAWSNAEKIIDAIEVKVDGLIAKLNSTEAELAAANAALTAVSDLLDEARSQRDAAREQVADAEGVCDIAQAAFDYHDCNPGTDDCEHAWYVLKGAIGHYRAVKAREHATAPAQVQP